MTRQTTGAEAQRGSAKLGPSDPQSTDQGVRENIYNRILNLLDENHVHGDLCREDLTDAILSLLTGDGSSHLAKDALPRGETHPSEPTSNGPADGGVS